MSLYARNLRDDDFTKTKALPAANANASTDALDLGQAKVQSLEEVEFEISVPATASLVNTKVITFVVQDSADNSSFAAVDPAISTTVTGGASGGAAKAVRFRLPSQTRRYVRVNAAIPSDGGANTAVSFTLSALF